MSHSEEKRIYTLISQSFTLFESRGLRFYIPLIAVLSALSAFYILLCWVQGDWEILPDRIGIQHRLSSLWFTW